MTKYTYYNIRLASSKRAMTSRIFRGRYSDTADLTSQDGFLSKKFLLFNYCIVLGNVATDPTPLLQISEQAFVEEDRELAEI